MNKIVIKIIENIQHALEKSNLNTTVVRCLTTTKTTFKFQFLVFFKVNTLRINLYIILLAYIESILLSEYYMFKS